MTIISGPAYLTPTWRYAGDDWAGSNALTYTVYSVAPVYADDGVTITTPGTPMDLTGFTVSGRILGRSRPVVSVNGKFGAEPYCLPIQGVAGGIILATAGTIVLSVPKAGMIAPRQDMNDWYGDIASNQAGARSRLIARPMISDPSGNLITVGLQPLYVL